MFYNCESFNQKVDIPPSVTMCGFMFYNCPLMNPDLVSIPSSIKENISEIFR